MEIFDLHTLETAPDGSKEVLTQLQKQNGMIHNLYAVMAEAPAVLQSYLQLGQIINQTSFNSIEKNVIWLAINYTNDCHYCMAIHTLIANKQKVPENIVKALRENQPINDTKLETLRQFTVLMVEKRGWASDEEVGNFMAAGYTKRQVLELILMIAQKTISNYANHIADTPPDDVSKPYEWKK